MWVLTSHSHVMQRLFPATSPRPWLPMIIGRHKTEDEAKGQLSRIKTANGGVLRRDTDYAIVKLGRN